MSNRSSKKPFVVLGIDASLTGTGLCLLTWADFKKKTPKTVTLTNRLTGVPRLIYIEQEIEKWAREADLVVIEDYAYEKKFRREVLGELQGVIKRRLYLMGKETVIVNTQKVKKILTGSGRKPDKYKHMDTKEWTIKETKRNYQIDFENRDNECDAFGLAFIGLCRQLYSTDSNALKSYPLGEQVVREIMNPPQKTPKRTIHYYYNLPYKIYISQNEDGTYQASCPGLNYSWNGSTPEEALENAKKGKKERIQELRRKKIRLKTAKKYMGGIAYIIKK